MMSIFIYLGQDMTSSMTTETSENIQTGVATSYGKLINHESDSMQRGLVSLSLPKALHTHTFRNPYRGPRAAF